MKFLLSLLTIIYLALIIPGFYIPSNKQKHTDTIYIKVDKKDILLNTVILEEFKNEFFNESSIIKSKSETENLDFELTLSTPKLFRFYSIKPQTAPLLIFIQPGDSVSYHLAENNSIIFEGKNASHYNFFTKINHSSYNYPIYNEKEGIWKYKEAIELIYNKRLAFLEEYEKNNVCSDLFIKRIKEVLKYEYLNWSLNRFMIPKEAISNNPKYLELIDYKLFDRNDQEDNGYFYLALVNYLHFFSTINDNSEANSNQKLEFQLNFIDKNLSGNTKEYAITKTLSEYQKRVNQENLDFLRKSVIKNLTQIKEKKYREALELITQKLEALGTELPQNVLKSRLIDVDGNSITLEEILNNNNIKVIDFWASWCAPCINEIKNSYQSRNKLAREKKITFLYFSIDKSQEKWKRKVIELKKFGMDKNQYLITEEANSVLGSYFSISSIPKYVVLNAANKTYMNNAPSPSSEEFEKAISQLDK
jgi:thiol-disulfide isomerase/thioredoxin